MAKTNPHTSSNTPASNDSDEKVTNPKYSEFDAPQTGGITSSDPHPNVPKDIFDTGPTGPVRDKEADPSKGTPVTRFFTKDGTPVEPSNLAGHTPSNLAGPDPEKMRDDVIAVVEYTDEGGNTVTNESLKTAKESKDKSSK